MFGFVDFRRSPVIRLFPSVADAHQTRAFRAWTMGEPYTFCQSRDVLTFSQHVAWITWSWTQTSSSQNLPGRHICANQRKHETRNPRARVSVRILLNGKTHHSWRQCRRDDSVDAKKLSNAEEESDREKITQRRTPTGQIRNKEFRVHRAYAYIQVSVHHNPPGIMTIPTIKVFLCLKEHAKLVFRDFTSPAQEGEVHMW